MPQKRKQGWVSPLPAGVSYCVNDTNPTGVFVQYIKGTSPSLQYAGTGNTTGEGFELPTDSDFLRDLAKAISATADEIDS